MADRPFDPDALRERYRAERDKRLRADGNDQYVEVAGPFARFLDDPYAERRERAPFDDEISVAIVGAGFGGLLSGVRLREAGIDDFRLIDRAGDVGGTWYWNRYPGAACDVESYIYLPLLEELGYMPRERYASAPEILEHSRAIARRFGLYERACLQTGVTALRWAEESRHWVIETDRGDRMRARFVILATGPLQKPKLPGIPGIESFAGHAFHTSRWDYAYTGGSPAGNLDRLHDKVVGIIGTGATAVQCVPHLGAAAKHLYVFQRTPSSVDVRNNRPTDPAWWASLPPGWQRRRMENFNNLVSGVYEPEDLVHDGWTDIIGRLIRRARETDGADGLDVARALELADFEKMEQIRARVDAIVRDPRTAAALKPYYRQFCKRPCFHDEYLATFNRPNVTLVDTDGKGVERITPRGPVVAGREYPLDCLVFATGFEVGTDYCRRAGFQVVGRDGLTLTDRWRDGAATFHGFYTRGFPNCFIISIVQSGFSVNIPHMLDEQARHLAYVLREARDRGITRIETSQAAEDAWVQTILDLARVNVAFLESCTPGYYNNEGKLTERTLRNGWYAGGSPAFISLLREWRARGDLAGLELS